MEAKIIRIAVNLFTSARSNLFHERHVHDVYKVEIMCFWAQEAEMSRVAVNLFQSARSKLFIDPTYMMSSKLESSALGHSCSK